MGRIMYGTAVVVTALGAASAAGSYTADILTCPGEVKSGGGDVSMPYCDENPEEDDLLNSPGTLEQKITYGGILVGALGGGALFLARRREDPQPGESS